MCLKEILSYENGCGLHCQQRYALLNLGLFNIFINISLFLLIHGEGSTFTQSLLLIYILNGSPYLSLQFSIDKTYNSTIHHELKDERLTQGKFFQ